MRLIDLTRTIDPDDRARHAGARLARSRRFSAPRWSTWRRTRAALRRCAGTWAARRPTCPTAPDGALSGCRACRRTWAPRRCPAALRPLRGQAGADDHRHRPRRAVLPRHRPRRPRRRAGQRGAESRLWTGRSPPSGRRSPRARPCCCARVRSAHAVRRRLLRLPRHEPRGHAPPGIARRQGSPDGRGRWDRPSGPCAKPSHGPETAHTSGTGTSRGVNGRSSSSSSSRTSAALPDAGFHVGCSR